MAPKIRQYSQSSLPLGLFAVILTAVFVTLKLTDVGAVADWDWLWVLAPLWIYVAVLVGLTILGIILLAIGLIIAYVITYSDNHKNRW